VEIEPIVLLGRQAEQCLFQRLLHRAQGLHADLLVLEFFQGLEMGEEFVLKGGEAGGKLVVAVVADDAVAGAGREAEEGHVDDAGEMFAGPRRSIEVR